jgi:hypothetical protein
MFTVYIRFWPTLTKWENVTVEKERVHRVYIRFWPTLTKWEERDQTSDLFYRYGERDRGEGTL